MASPKNHSASDTGVSEDGSFAPLDALQEMLDFWWLLFLFIVAGGLVGWFVHQARPPVYEAVGQFSASIDFVRTGPLTQLEEDVALNAVGNIVSSGTVIKTVVEQAHKEGIDITAQSLRKNSVIERRLDTWQIRVRNHDPQIAERLVNIWVEQGQAALLKSYESALKAGEYQRLLESLESCLERSVDIEPSGGQCSTDDAAKIQADMAAAGEVYAKARLGSLGLFEGLILGPVEKAIVSGQPVILARNQVVLAGCLLGLLVGTLMIQLRVPSRWMKRS